MRSANRKGFTMIELMVALFLSLIVIFAIGKILTSSQKAWSWGRDKAVLQANSTEALEWMARSIRAARRLQVVSTSEFRTYDENGALVHTFQRATVGGVGRLQQDGSNLVARTCTAFNVTPDPDTTSLSLTLELQDDSGNKIREVTRAAIRNRSFEF
jgi:prepilin-type N-terminal cleavage/methylation domain-containing protein